jgi:hypothetical protein
MATEQSATQSAAQPVKPTTKDNWALGVVVFAGCMMMMIGIFQMIQGIAAIIKDEFFVATPRYAFEFDVTAWGWIHLVMGLVLIFAGYLIFAGLTLARAIGITAAALSAIANFMSLPHYPVWSLLIIALDVAVIWALTVYMRPYKDAAS